MQLTAQMKDYTPGVARTGLYYEAVQGKSLAVVGNATSLLPNGTHTVDHLISLGADIREVWAPEHGFRGNKDAGEHVDDGRDPKTGIRIRSLYGKNKRPNTEWLKGLDLVVYDIQDVGVRFYTYSTTLSYVLDACVEAGVALMIFDRGNPNGHYVDGPILAPGFESMVGLHPIPVVHGLTMGEYAQMVYGERWMPMTMNSAMRSQFEKSGGLQIIPCEGYSHDQVFSAFQIPPSPNLRSIESIWNYPSLCFFEGTPISCGRGTNGPFTQFGAPFYKPDSMYAPVFTPKPDQGAKYPKHNGQLCYGVQITKRSPVDEIDWSYVFDAYTSWKKLPQSKPDFFNSFFEKLAGSERLRKALTQGLTTDEWKKQYLDTDFNSYLEISRQYKLY